VFDSRVAAASEAAEHLNRRPKAVATVAVAVEVYGEGAAEGGG
jgi:hypothetical protein